MYFLLLCVGIHHREMIQRKSLNYERVLNVETTKTNDLIANLIPGHQLQALLNEQRLVDELDNMTILFVDIPKLASFQKDIVSFLQKLFTRFDQLTIENKVYKIQTIGDTYIIIGYTSRIEKS
jgi:adenylate cyclase